LKVLEERDLFDWFNRYRQRQRDLAAGADADLVRSNRRQFKFALWCTGISLLLIGVDGRLHDIPEDVVGFIAVVLLMAGILVGQLAMRERLFLRAAEFV
jgi:GAF domain-containing protein